MATGYEVQMYNDINRIAKCLESIAKSLNTITMNTTPTETDD